MPRAGRSSEIPPPLELECLRALWSLGEGSVKDVRHQVARSRDFAYTTVMTVLERLARRGMVTRRKNGRAFFYTPVLDREHARRLALKELIGTYFEGSSEALRLYLERVPLEPKVGSPETGEPALDPTLL